MDSWMKPKVKIGCIILLVVFSLFCFSLGRCAANGDVGSVASSGQIGECLSGPGALDAHGNGGVDEVAQRLAHVERILVERDGDVDQVVEGLSHIEQIINERKRALEARDQAIKTLIKDMEDSRNLSSSP